MVFIAIGAFKAAKAAKREYDKDKKRSEVITSLHNPRRNEFDNAPASSSPDWWSSDEPPEAEPQRPQVSHNAFGAWSRDQLMEQIAEQQSRQEENDVRFREQHSSSSASHSPALAVAQTRSESDQEHTRDDSPQQVLPPTISAPLLEEEEDSQEARASHIDAQASASREPNAKPPRPAKPFASVEGSYEAMLKSSATDIRQSRRRKNIVSEGSSAGAHAQESRGSDGNSQVRTTPRPGNALEPVEGSFESALRNGTASSRYPPKPNLSSAEHANQSGVQLPSALPSIAQTKRLTKPDSAPMHPLTATAPLVKDTDHSQSVEKQTEQVSAFASASATKRVIRRPSGASRSPQGGNPVLSRTGSTTEGSHTAQSNQGSAFPKEGLCTRTKRTSRDVPAAATGPPTTALRTTTQANLNGNPSTFSPNGASRDISAGASCMSAEGTMKKRRSRRPLQNN